MYRLSIGRGSYMPVDDLHDFPRAEYQRRLDGFRALMAERGMDAALVTTEANHRYFTGHVTHRWSHHYVAIFALLPLEGEPMLVVQPNEAYMCEADSWIEIIPSDLYPTSTTTSDDDTFNTVPVMTSPSAMFRKLPS